ncbi:MAG: MFS transporter, partial [Myxococcota bacterium]|nr:MFS transporter [Myxococcota bacterium]
VSKGAGMFAYMTGVVLGGAVMVRLGLYRCLIAFGVLQAATNLMFVALAEVGHHYPLMVATVMVEKFAAGMGDVPFLTLLMALCDSRFTAFQYALLSSVPALGRTLVGATAGVVVEAIDWSAFFLITTFVAVPALALAYKLRGAIEDLDERTEDSG